MSETAATEASTESSEATEQGNPGEEALGDPGKKALDAMKAERNQAKAELAELRKQQRAAMTESERAVAEAEERGRTAAVTEFGKRLARTEFDAVAGRRNPDFDTASALEFVDLSRFLGDDGEPDTKAIKAAVERLVPAPANGAPSFDGGSRTSSSQGGDMNSIIRKAAGLG